MSRVGCPHTLILTFLADLRGCGFSKGCLTVLGGHDQAWRFPWGKPWGQTGYSQPIPKAGIGGSPRFAAHLPPKMVRHWFLAKTVRQASVRAGYSGMKGDGLGVFLKDIGDGFWAGSVWWWRRWPA